MLSDDHPARDEQKLYAPGAAVPSQARRARAVVDFRPYPTAPTRTRRSPANSGRPHARRGGHPTPSTVWFTATRHEAGPVITDPPCLSGRGGAPETEPAGAVWPLSVLARAVTSFTDPSAAVLLVPWPAAARGGLGQPVPLGVVAAVAELGRRPHTADLPDGAAGNDAVPPRPDVPNDRVDLLITAMPARHDAAGHTDTVARLAARALRLGGVLVVLTHCDRSDGVLIDPSGPMVTAGQNADLLYLQHVVAVHLPPAQLRTHPAHRADGRTPTAHRRVHSDVLVFAQPHDDGARPAAARPAPARPARP